MKARRNHITTAVEDSQVAKIRVGDLSVNVLRDSQPENGAAPRGLNRHSKSKAFRLRFFRLVAECRQTEQDGNPNEFLHHTATFASFLASGGIGARYPTISSRTPVPMNETMRSR